MRPRAASDHDQICRLAASALAVQLRARRKDLGLSQEEVAHLAGLAVPVYGRLERGESSKGDWANPTLDTLLRVFSALRYEFPGWNITGAHSSSSIAA